MRRTRLTAAGVAAALALGGTLAGASTVDDQTVTIAVTTAPLTLSLGDDQIDFNVPQNTDLGAGEQTEESTITFHNPPGSDTETAKVTVTVGETANSLNDVNSTPQRQLTLKVAVGSATGFTGGDASWVAGGGAGAGFAQDLVTAIGRGDERADVALTWSLEGQTGNLASQFTVGTFTFTITS